MRARMNSAYEVQGLQDNLLIPRKHSISGLTQISAFPVKYQQIESYSRTLHKEKASFWNRVQFFLYNNRN